VTKLGFVCQLVENGVEAVGEYVRGDTHYDLILMDIQMPGISGHEATELIRKHEEEFNWARVPIVAITANIEKEVHSQSLRVGMDGHFGKPVTRLVLDELIRKALLGITI
jgi:CheY-like chemotaxis protein